MRWAPRGVVSEVSVGLDQVSHVQWHFLHLGIVEALNILEGPAII